ncbi:MAG: tyrosine-type recombinase/integrase [Oscillospiraceae bacterium]|nr:tyrosine-type recombinase/integrase [Oscillospiraceae bacterium]
MKKIKMTTTENKTFEEGFEEYVLDMKSRNLRDGTIRHYEQSIKQIYKRIPPQTPIENLTSKTVPEFIVKLRDDPKLNDVSMGTYARDLKTLMRFFMRCGYLEHFEIKIPKADKEPIETYTDDELQKLLIKPDLRKCTFANYRSWVIICLILSTGIRQNSIINLKCKDIDFDNRMLYVNVTKNRKPLIIPLNEDMIKILKEYFQYRKAEADDWLFCNIYGKKLVKSTIYHGLFDYCHFRGVGKTGVHRFRHTFAKKWIIMGGSVVTLQKVLGHSSLAITENYINMLVSDLKKDLDEVNIIRSLKPTHLTMKKKH